MRMMIVRVETRDAETGELESTREIDYHNSEHRKWLGRHSYWAFCNDKSITTFQIDID